MIGPRAIALDIAAHGGLRAAIALGGGVLPVRLGELGLGPARLLALGWQASSPRPTGSGMR